MTVCQRLAAGSLISAEEDEAGDAVHFLVCVNIDEASAAAPSSVTEAERGAADERATCASWRRRTGA